MTKCPTCGSTVEKIVDIKQIETVYGKIGPDFDHDGMHQTILDLTESLKEAIDVITFYASKESWNSPNDESGHGPEIHRDGGWLAKEFLKKVGEHD